MSALSLISLGHAEYQIKMPLEQSNRGALPNGSINILDKKNTLPNWQSTTPFYTEWADTGEKHECSTWVPDESTKKEGIAFEQTTICGQDQVRTKQEREIDSISLTFRNIGEPIDEIQSIFVYSARQSIGTQAPIWDCPPFSRSIYNWMDSEGGLGMNVYMIWGGAYATNPSSIINAKSPYKDISSGYVYRKGAAMIYETEAIHYAICRTPI